MLEGRLSPEDFQDGIIRCLKFDIETASAHQLKQHRNDLESALAIVENLGARKTPPEIYLKPQSVFYETMLELEQERPGSVKPWALIKYSMQLEMINKYYEWLRGRN